MFLKPQKIIFNSIIQKYKLKNIKPNQSNNNQKLIDQLEIDIKLNGLLCPLVVNNNVLVDGHHRYEAIKDFCTETLVYELADNIQN